MLKVKRLLKSFAGLGSELSLPYLAGLKPWIKHGAWFWSQSPSCQHVLKTAILQDIWRYRKEHYKKSDDTVTSDVRIKHSYDIINYRSPQRFVCQNSKSVLNTALLFTNRISSNSLEKFTILNCTLKLTIFYWSLSPTDNIVRLFIWWKNSPFQGLSSDFL